MYRTIDTATWKDPWFSELSRDARLVFLYLITNDRTLPSGLLEITPRILAFESGVDGADLQAALGELAPKVTCWWQHNTVWVHSFYRYQRANSNDKFRISAARSLANFAPEVRQAVCNAYPELSNKEGIPPQSHTNGIPIPSPSLPPSHTNKETVTVTETETGDLRGEPVLEPPAREPAREAAAPAPRTTALRSVPKTTTPDRNDLAWLEQEVRERAVKAGFDPPTLLAEIDVGDQTNRWHDFEPAAGKGKPTWRNWMRLEIDKQLATLKGAKNGSKANGKHNGHQSARERQDQSALAAIQFFGAPPPDGGVPDQDPPASGPGIPGRSDGGRSGFVDVTPRYLGDRPG